MKGIKRCKRSRGFNLIEVMVALAILAMSFTTLILAQARTTRLAISGRDMAIATSLARLKLMECKRETRKQISAISDLNLSGDFINEGFEKFTWECHAPKFNMKAPSASELEEGIKSKTPDKDKPQMNVSLAGPIISLITDNLSEAVRELAVIIRWKDGQADEEVRVVTHVIDTLAMGRLALMLSQQSDGSKKSKAQGTEQNPSEGPPKMPPPNKPPGENLNFIGEEE